jgi:hypothetical protein
MIRFLYSYALLHLALVLLFSNAFGDEPTFQSLDDEFSKKILPLIRSICLECHSTEEQEAELDLEIFRDLAAVRRDPEVWQKAAKFVRKGKMPPVDGPKLAQADRDVIVGWIDAYLTAEADADAGDPGPVVLRRLSNAEYNHTVRDLTGVDLRPAATFPADGAAGEGFTNTGMALVMSPALLDKYYGAAKKIAKHAVLTPEGFHSSPSSHERDWLHDAIGAIQKFYAQFADPDGFLPLERYIAATLKHRDALSSGSATVEEVAEKENLNAPYLALLWKTLTAGTPSAVLDSIRSHWAKTSPGDAAAITSMIKAWQDVLWKLDSLSISWHGNWQVPEPATAASRKFTQKITMGDDDTETTLYLTALDIGDGPDGDVVAWKQPRLVSNDQKKAPIFLVDVAPLVAEIESNIDNAVRSTSDYLAGVVELSKSKSKGSGSLETIAQSRDLDPDVLRAWTEYLDIGASYDLEIAGLITEPHKSVGGYGNVNGWGTKGPPSVIVNDADSAITILTITVPPRSVAVHPSPDKQFLVGWKSPIDGSIRIDGSIADADDGAGNGVAWMVELVRANEKRQLAAGRIEEGATRTPFQLSEPVEVTRGDVIYLVVDAYRGNYGHDSTAVELTLVEEGGAERTWSLGNDIVDTVLEGNPHADSLGNRDVWHFAGRDSATHPFGGRVDSESILGKWREAALDPSRHGELADLAKEVEHVLTSRGDLENPADANFRRDVTAWEGHFRWLSVLDRLPKSGLPPEGDVSDAKDIIVTAPSELAFTVPAVFAKGRTLIAEATLDPERGKEGSVQVLLATPQPDILVQPGAKLLVNEGSQTAAKLLPQFAAFRDVFPAGLCYSRVAPMHEGQITLRIYHREDDQLKRLMLDVEQRREIDRLWHRLHFISKDHIRVYDSYDVFIGFTTQVSKEQTTEFEGYRAGYRKAAEDLKRQLVESEAVHLEALLEFAARAYRKPLEPVEVEEIRELYKDLRDRGIGHEAAFRSALAGVLVSPPFLYRIEEPKPGKEAQPVNAWELATRLSYTLWASMPDAELFAAARDGNLLRPEVLEQQTRRMMSDPRARGLAEEFATQWLGIRDFEHLSEKNEKLFPDFDSVRGDLYEEAVQFFTDLIVTDGSVLGIWNAGHVFVNGRLAKHYGIPGIEGEGWQRVDDAGRYSRGGILGMGSVLAKQSGASRTSPVLRGFWVVETLLGEELPNPPANVPELPDTVDRSSLSVRQLTERHRSAPECAGCHQRIDPYGFALEAFGATGRFRTKDLAGHAIDASVVLKDNTRFEGIAGLRNYLLGQRREELLRQFCRKLLGYATGRTVVLSDKQLVDVMMAALQKNNHRMSAAILTLVQSKQFLMQRGMEYAAPGNSK